MTILSIRAINFFFFGVVNTRDFCFSRRKKFIRKTKWFLWVKKIGHSNSRAGFFKPD